MKQLMDVEAVAGMLGVPVSFVYDRTRKNSPDPIPHFKVGKYVRFDPEAVAQWLTEHSR